MENKLEFDVREVTTKNKVKHNEVQKEVNESYEIFFNIIGLESKRRLEKMRYGFFNPSYCKQFGYLSETDVELEEKLIENKEAVLESAKRN